MTREKKVFEMDSRSDPFWRANRGLPFPSVAEAVEQELAACKKREAQIRSAGGSGDPSLQDNTSRIKDAVSSLPLLLEQKRQLTGHMSLLMAVMDKIKEGKVCFPLVQSPRLLSRLSFERVGCNLAWRASAGITSIRI